MSDPQSLSESPSQPSRHKLRYINPNAGKKGSVLHHRKVPPRTPDRQKHGGSLKTSPTSVSPRTTSSSGPILKLKEHASDEDESSISSLLESPKGAYWTQLKSKFPSSDARLEPYSPPPVTVLQKGNSDPFNSTSIPVDASVNALMSFYRDIEIPSLYQLDSKSWVAAPAAVKDWTDQCNGLVNDSCFAYAFLARISTVISKISPHTELTKQALVYRARSTTLLRAKLADKQQLLTTQTLQAIRGLFSAEVLAKNLPAATVHGKMLRFLSEKRSETEKVDLVILNQILYNDTQLAAMFLSRPTFDVDGWLAMVFTPSWTAAVFVLPSLSSASTSYLDPSISSDKLRKLFVMRREAMIVWLQPTSKGPKGSPLAWNWLISRNLIGQGRLISHYLDMVSKYKDCRKSMLDNVYAQAYLSLAALYSARVLSTSPRILGKPLFDAEPTILRNLQTELEKSETPFDPIEAPKYSNARLWALYIGAGAEQARAKDGYDPSRDWFNSRLAEQAQRMGLLSWQPVRTVLEGFLYTDQSKPHGSLWFYKTMSANLEDDSTKAPEIRDEPAAV